MQSDYQTRERMKLKLEAVPLPDMNGKRVLDVGTDFGEWCYIAERAGARDVLGLDRNRNMAGTHIDLVKNNRAYVQANGLRSRFERIDLGCEYYEYGKFDVVFCLSMYHHAFESAGGNHDAIWYWLSRHVHEDGEVIWEGPMDTDDPVVARDVSVEHLPAYNKARILEAALKYFDSEFIGPALHVASREVWRFKPKFRERLRYRASVRSGSGTASKVFQFAEGRRQKEVEQILGVLPIPGSLNLRLNRPFHWDEGYYRAKVLDVERVAGWRDSDWYPRWARFYPVVLSPSGHRAWAFRFENESYPADFVELLSKWRLRDSIGEGEEIELIC